MQFALWKWFLIIRIITVLESAVASEKHMICKDVGDVFSPSPPSQITFGNRGIPGKRGAKGDIGPPGAAGGQGKPGEVNLTKIESLIMQEVQKSRVEMSKNFQEAERFVRNIRNGLCHVEHDGKCFWISFYKMNYYQAETECAKFAGNVSNIYSQSHYQKIMSYARQIMPAGLQYIEPWLGMTLNIATLQVSLRDGTPAPFVKWHPAYPRNSNSKNTQINLQVRPDVNTATQNMWNYDPTFIRDGALCEYAKIIP